MKLSVSLPDEDVEFLNAYAQAHALSRSAAVRRAIGELRAGQLSHAYGQAWDEWTSTADADLWDAVAGDGR
jgi:hypothetical protein